MTEETELREHSRFATFRKGTSNKFYQIRVTEKENEQADVVYTWGRIGTAGQSKTDQGYYSYAVNVANEQFEKKLKKGYVEQKSSLVLLAMTIEEPEERKGDGLKPVDVQFVMPSVSPKMEERLGKFARKYLSKLNLVRKDKFSLKPKQYEKQIEDLGRQFTAEFDRICSSKGYGAEVNDDVKQAVIYFYRALRDETKLGAYRWPMRNFGFPTGLYD
jgi:predicted DNA-binding WGR domain protein